MKAIRKVYGPYLDSSKTRRIVILHYTDGTKKTKANARHLLEQHLGRELESTEEADHVDGDPLNDDLDNLQVLTKSAHRQKTMEDHPRPMVVFICPVCGTEAAKPKSVVEANRRQGKAGPYCGKRCSGKIHH